MTAGSPVQARRARPEAQTLCALPEGATAQLRLLGTTDIHAHLMAYDYYADEGGQPYGLVRVATAIRAARAEAANTLLFDNGDALQGTPMGDLTTCSEEAWQGPSPVITAMNHLGYDAAALGNHEFNFGIDWLARTLRCAKFPVTCGNVEVPSATDESPWPVLPSVILERTLICDDGAARPIKVGVLGLVPPQITMWDQMHLSGRLSAKDMVETARRMIPKLRANGADIVILLAHSGIDARAPDAMAENAALALAGLDGVDAIMTGHSHQIFPLAGQICPDAAKAGIDHKRGLLSGTPAVMAGACGGHLGVLDLTVTASNGRWRCSGHRAEVRDAAALPCDLPLKATLAPAHDMTLRHMRQPIGRAAMRLHSYLALAPPDPSVAALNAVQTQLLARALAGTPHEGLPIVSATPAFKTGGRGGPSHFTDLPEGPLSRRHAADLYPFPNSLCGIEIDGAGLRDWLERAAICFATLQPGAPDQMLRDMDVPGHDFDVISGLTYTIDLAAPPLYDRSGNRTEGGTGRIRDLRHQGRPLAEDARLILATNTYRAFGAGAYAPTPPERLVYVSTALLRQELVEHVAHTPLAPPEGFAENWAFAPMPGTHVLLDTGPGLRSDAGALDATGGTDLGDGPGGFWRVCLPL
ncbi:bifunctional 2',3'-cyclic-nucleotide 2'-phosphodiesterase/3'-nucleotidase [Roseovarius sp. D0-M9]|uniref:bifunctional 2',3'-cyclic-nucleotide 2'-phosphodiesterase/3'-nucleotidase n=1 Tax=Roseovarius sp. D0-M9 TaxID=3127117 RepID=UPI00300FB68E